MKGLKVQKNKNFLICTPKPISHLVEKDDMQFGDYEDDASDSGENQGITLASINASMVTTH